jgi:hypothetical protein
MCICTDHAQWHTRLLEPEKLPDLHSVRSLQLSDNGGSGVLMKFDYRIAIDILAHLPNVEQLDCHIGADQWIPTYEDEPAKSSLWEFDGPRRDSRHDFAKAISSSVLPTSLREAELDFISDYEFSDSYLDHYKAQPDLISPARKDPFSTSLRVLSYNLRKLKIRAQVDDTLFWSDNGSNPTWPHLEELSVMFHIVSSSRAYYFEGPRGEGRDLRSYEVNESSYPYTDKLSEWDCCDDERGRSFESYGSVNFRICATDERIAPFLASFAKAAANMPNLKTAMLWSPLRWDPLHTIWHDDETLTFASFESPFETWAKSLAWGLEYAIAGQVSAIDSRIVRSGRDIRWSVGHWRPDAQLHGLFQNIGREQHGENLRESFEDKGFGSNVVPRAVFEDRSERCMYGHEG